MAPGWAALALGLAAAQLGATEPEEAAGRHGESVGDRRRAQQGACPRGAACDMDQLDADGDGAVSRTEYEQWGRSHWAQ